VRYSPRMQPVSLQHGRAEQVIALARILFALVALVVVVLDSSLAPRDRYALVVSTAAAYLLWTMIVGWFARARLLHSFRARAVTHAVDVVAATLLVSETQSPVSPLFPLYILSLFSALLRFRVRGIVLTALVVIVSYTTMAVTQGFVVNDVSFFISRITYIVVTSLLLCYLGTVQQRVHDELSQLAAWPRRGFEQRDPLVRHALEKSTELLRSRRAVAVFEQLDEPWLWIAEHQEGKFSIIAEGPEAAVLTGDAGSETFFCSDVRDANAVTVVIREGAIQTIRKCFVEPAFASRLGIRSVLATPFQGEKVTGWLFFLEPSDVGFDEVALSQIVAQLFAARLDEFALVEAERLAAVSDERIRLARDLHDTILQSLAAISLQLETVLRTMDSDPENAARRVRALQELLGKDQAELRTLIAQLRPRAGIGEHSSLKKRLLELPLWLLQQWDTIVSVDIDPIDADVSASLRGEIVTLVREAVANAAKHARASHVKVIVKVSDLGGARIDVVDDGSGFPFEGQLDLARMEEENVGPRTLRERVRALEGTLTITSSESGSTLRMTIPASRTHEILRNG
jgi:signal transduction histidine kinase